MIKIGSNRGYFLLFLFVLILIELLSDAKQLLRVAVDGISRGFVIRKTKGNVKIENYRMMKYSNRSKVWRLAVRIEDKLPRKGN